MVARSRRKYHPRQAVYSFLTEDEWLRLYNLQGGSCAICGSALRNRLDPADRRPLAYCDHSHEEEKSVGIRRSIRGLLCLRCNRYLLHEARDSSELLRRAADYLENPPARSIVEDTDPDVLLHPAV